MVSVRPHLWFGNDKALEAATFYAEHIPDSAVTRTVPAPAGDPRLTEAEYLVVEFTVSGVPYVALNAGPTVELDEAFAFYLSVDGQDEVDHYWDLLTADGGKPGPCGWCTDRFGVSWQVIPKQLEELSGDYSTEANLRVVRAMLQMHKIDVAELERAAQAGED